MAFLQLHFLTNQRQEIAKSKLSIFSKFTFVHLQKKRNGLIKKPSVIAQQRNEEKESKTQVVYAKTISFSIYILDVVTFCGEKNDKKKKYPRKKRHTESLVKHVVPRA